MAAGKKPAAPKRAASRPRTGDLNKKAGDSNTLSAKASYYAGGTWNTPFVSKQGTRTYWSQYANAEGSGPAATSREASRSAWRNAQRTADAKSVSPRQANMSGPNRKAKAVAQKFPKSNQQMSGGAKAQPKRGVK